MCQMWTSHWPGSKDDDRYTHSPLDLPPKSWWMIRMACSHFAENTKYSAGRPRGLTIKRGAPQIGGCMTFWSGLHGGVESLQHSKDRNFDAYGISQTLILPELPHVAPFNSWSPRAPIALVFLRALLGGASQRRDAVLFTLGYCQPLVRLRCQ